MPPASAGPAIAPSCIADDETAFTDASFSRATNAGSSAAVAGDWSAVAHPRRNRRA